MALNTDPHTGDDGHLRFRLIDVRQREVARTVARASLTPGEETALTAEFVPPARGCFKVALDAGESADALGWVEDLGGFTVLAPSFAETPARPGSAFGGHMDGINHKWHFRAGRTIGLQWARCHDMLQTGWWTRIQARRARAVAVAVRRCPVGAGWPGVLHAG